MLLLLCAVGRRWGGAVRVARLDLLQRHRVGHGGHERHAAVAAAGAQAAAQGLQGGGQAAPGADAMRQLLVLLAAPHHHLLLDLGQREAAPRRHGGHGRQGARSRGEAAQDVSARAAAEAVEASSGQLPRTLGRLRRLLLLLLLQLLLLVLMLLLLLLLLLRVLLLQLQRLLLLLQRLLLRRVLLLLLLLLEGVVVVGVRVLRRVERGVVAGRLAGGVQVQALA